MMLTLHVPTQDALRYSGQHLAFQRVISTKLAAMHMSSCAYCGGSGCFYCGGTAQKSEKA